MDRLTAQELINKLQNFPADIPIKVVDTGGFFPTSFDLLEVKLMGNELWLCVE